MSHKVRCPRCGCEDTEVSVPAFLGCIRHISCAGKVMFISFVLMVALIFSDLKGDTDLLTGTIMWGTVFLGMIFIELPATLFSKPFTIVICRNPLCGFSWKPAHSH